MRGGGGPSHTSFLNMSWLEQTLWKIFKGCCSILQNFWSATFLVKLYSTKKPYSWTPLPKNRLNDEPSLQTLHALGSEDMQLHVAMK